MAEALSISKCEHSRLLDSQKKSANFKCEICEDIMCCYDNLKLHLNDHLNPESNSKESVFKPQKEYLGKIENFSIIKLGNSEHILGTGSIGNIVLAKNQIDNKYYAIKRIYKQLLLESGGNYAQIYKEGRIHRGLVHENIVRLHSFIEDDNCFYLVMDYARGGSLYDKIQICQGLDEPLCFKYFIQVISAVEFLHRNNFVHRDIKPENLLIDEKDCVKLCDFGWCIDVTNKRETFCGTFEYMAPEIIKELPYNHGVDIWSLGVLLYEMVHGYSPFSRSANKQKERLTIPNLSHQDIFNNILKRKFEIGSNISSILSDLIQRILTIEQSKRISIQDIIQHNWIQNKKDEISKVKLLLIQEQINIIKNENTEVLDLIRHISEEDYGLDLCMNETKSARQTAGIGNIKHKSRTDFKQQPDIRKTVKSLFLDQIDYDSSEIDDELEEEKPLEQARLSNLEFMRETAHPSRIYNQSTRFSVNSIAIHKETNKINCSGKIETIIEMAEQENLMTEMRERPLFNLFSNIDQTRISEVQEEFEESKPKKAAYRNSMLALQKDFIRKSIRKDTDSYLDTQISTDKADKSSNVNCKLEPSKREFNMFTDFLSKENHRLESSTSLITNIVNTESDFNTPRDYDTNNSYSKIYTYKKRESVPTTCSKNESQTRSNNIKNKAISEVNLRNKSRVFSKQSMSELEVSKTIHEISENVEDIEKCFLGTASDSKKFKSNKTCFNNKMVDPSLKYSDKSKSKFPGKKSIDSEPFDTANASNFFILDESNEFNTGNFDSPYGSNSNFKLSEIEKQVNILSRANGSNNKVSLESSSRGSTFWDSLKSLFNPFSCTK